MKDKFLYLEQFMTALEDLDKEDIYRATYVLCYYGLYREFPEEATAIDKMYVKANAKLFDGQDAYAVKQAERGKKGGRPSDLSDERIEEAILELYDELGKIPSEKAVLDRLGGAAAIRHRNAWKNREAICAKREKSLSQCEKGLSQNNEDNAHSSHNLFNF